MRLKQDGQNFVARSVRLICCLVQLDCSFSCCLLATGEGSITLCGGHLERCRGPWMRYYCVHLDAFRGDRKQTCCWQPWEGIAACQQQSLWGAGSSLWPKNSSASITGVVWSSDLEITFLIWELDKVRLLSEDNPEENCFFL